MYALLLRDSTFIAIDQLLKVRDGVLDLREKISNLNEQVQSTGSKLVDKKKDVIESRKCMINVEAALETMQSCIFLLDMASKVQTRIDQCKYYSALKV
jgi:hypothetical protein